MAEQLKEEENARRDIEENEKSMASETASNNQGEELNNVSKRLVEKEAEIKRLGVLLKKQKEQIKAAKEAEMEAKRLLNQLRRSKRSAHSAGGQRVQSAGTQNATQKKKELTKGVAIANKKHGHWEHHPKKLEIKFFIVESQM